MFWSDTLAIPKQNVSTCEIDPRIPVMVEDVLQWPTMGGTYLEVIGCLGAALADLSGGVINFNTADGFGDCIDFGTHECEDLAGAGVLREPIDSNRSFPVMSTFSIVLAALEIFRHMLAFRCSVSCFGSG